MRTFQLRRGGWTWGPSWVRWPCVRQLASAADIFTHPPIHPFDISEPDWGWAGCDSRSADTTLQTLRTEGRSSEGEVAEAKLSKRTTGGAQRPRSPPIPGFCLRASHDDELLSHHQPKGGPQITQTAPTPRHRILGPLRLPPDHAQREASARALSTKASSRPGQPEAQSVTQAPPAPVRSAALCCFRKGQPWHCRKGCNVKKRPQETGKSNTPEERDESGSG